jgi:hypothetical protein
VSTQRIIVPVDMGGSPHTCAVAPPPTAPPTPALVQALIEHYRTERASDKGRLEVGFYRGGIPDDALLEACDGLPIRVSFHPADLDKGAAKRLRTAGVETMEVEALSFDPHVLRIARRDYTLARVHGMLRHLREMGFHLGVHLVPGLPGTDAVGAMSDVEAILEPNGPLVDFVRIWPAIAFEGTELAKWATEGSWQPWTVAEAADVIHRMLDRFDLAAVPVIRVGLQPGQDIPTRAVAGPVHPNLRGEVEARRFQKRMALLLAGSEAGSRVVLRVHPKDLGWAKGTSNANARALRTRLGLEEITIEPDAAVARGTVQRGRRT